ncbi:MAG: hypothetical protein DHS20C15_34460 [Planctomycetota bacterium]|nr:MAG: hypothetical protein DHS20C15_34460 [Planctomycetota bacterium]
MIDLLACPECRSAAANAEGCPDCELRPSQAGGVIDWLANERLDVPEPDVNRFYEARPFPGYAEGDDASSLLDRCRRSGFLTALDRSIPPDAKVLDAGCGTGQISAFLALSSLSREVVGVDACSASLAAAANFRDRTRAENLTLCRGDLFSLPVAEQGFDVVNCRGVVHHNADWQAATRSVARHVKPGGVLVLGFYENIARLPHRIRRRLAAKRRRPFTILDPVLRRSDLDEEKKLTWIEDQYRHPLEWCLPFPQVVKLLDDCGFDWVRSVPPTPAQGGLFDPTPRPSAFGLALRRWGWALTPGDQDAGLVGYVAKRRAR